MRSFDIEALSKAIESIQNVDFSQLFGSSRDGLLISDSADIDIAVYLNIKPNQEILAKITALCRKACKYEKIDLIALNDADPILAFEALYGNNITCRNPEMYCTFYSQTCRYYEDEMTRIEKFFSYLDLQE